MVIFYFYFFFIFVVPFCFIHPEQTVNIIFEIGIFFKKVFSKLTCAMNRITVQLQTFLELNSDISESGAQEDDGQIV